MMNICKPQLGPQSVKSNAKIEYKQNIDLLYFNLE